MRACARMNCGSQPSVTIALRYGDREVLVRDLFPEHDPNFLDLCGEHLSRLTPPIGWRVRDVRQVASAAP